MLIGVMDAENARRLGSKVGDVVLIEDLVCERLLIQSFLYARVNVDLRKSLLIRLWSLRPGKDIMQIKVRY